MIKKAVQVGISELLICDAFGRADMGLRVFYVLPTIDLRNTFVRDRIDRPLLTVPYYRHRAKPTKKEEAVMEIDNVGLKSFGENGLLFFVGSNSPVSFISFPADVAIIDELDKCHESNLALVPDRLSASKYKFIRQVSTPTIEGFGIDQAYNQSDKKHWLVKCEHCGDWWELDFFTHVVRQSADNVFELVDQEWNDNSKEDIGVFCKKCMKKINRLSQGEHVAEHPKNYVSGYSISELFSANLTIAQIYHQFLEALTNESKKQRFYNSILGLAYTAPGVKLTRAVLDECIKAGQNYQMPSRSDNTTMGVDVGQPLLHVLIHDYPIEGHRRLVFAGTVRDFEELHTLIARFGVRSGTIDVKPETRKAKEFQVQANSKDCQIWLCEYPSAPQDQETSFDLDQKLIKADRTQTMDALVNDYLRQLILLPANASTLEDGDFYAQLCAPTRVFDEATGRYYYTEGSRVDHFFHADCYSMLARQFFSEKIEPAYVEKRDPFPHRKLKGITR